MRWRQHTTNQGNMNNHNKEGKGNNTICYGVQNLFLLLGVLPCICIRKNCRCGDYDFLADVRCTLYDLWSIIHEKIIVTPYELNIYQNKSNSNLLPTLVPASKSSNVLCQISYVDKHWTSFIFIAEKNHVYTWRRSNKKQQPQYAYGTLIQWLLYELVSGKSCDYNWVKILP